MEIRNDNDRKLWFGIKSIDKKFDNLGRIGSKDFDWLGKHKNPEIDEFIEQPFDVLISYYKKQTLELNLITALSKANFKIGLNNEDDRLHDFIIEVDPLKIAIFKTELIKYLTTLNRL